MSTISIPVTTPCDCGACAEYRTLDGAPVCWRCAETVDGPIVAAVPFRGTRSGRVFAAGSTIPAAFVADAVPVASIEG